LGGGIRTTDCDKNAHFNPDATLFHSNMMSALFLMSSRMVTVEPTMWTPLSVEGILSREAISFAWINVELCDL
jgi:hypothetical protein